MTLIYDKILFYDPTHDRAGGILGYGVVSLI